VGGLEDTVGVEDGVEETIVGFVCASLESGVAAGEVVSM